MSRDRTARAGYAKDEKPKLWIGMANCMEESAARNSVPYVELKCLLLITYGERKKVRRISTNNSVQARELGYIFGASGAVRDIYRYGFVSASHIAVR